MLMVEDINNEIQRKRILETPRFGSRTDTVQSDFFLSQNNEVLST
jgi:hypothetical protein